MTKTPEQMAEEFFENWQPEKPKYIRPKARQYALEKVTECFLAGYQAAKDQLADVDKVMNSSNNSNGWISVKDRLPEKDQDVLWYNPTLLKPMDVCPISPLWNGSLEHNTYTHWMPLPKPPEDK